MSDWTYIHGTILVDPLARTQPEGQYIVDTVGTCLNCPMKIGRYCKCSTDIFADWLKTEALKTETKD